MQGGYGNCNFPEVNIASEKDKLKVDLGANVIAAVGIPFKLMY